MDRPTRWYKRTWGLVVLLVCFFPAGLYLVWVSGGRRPRVRRVVRGVSAAWLLCLVAGCANSAGGGALPAGSSARSTPPSSPPAAPLAGAAPVGDEPAPGSTAAVATTGLTVPPPASASACRTGSPLANVYHPYRLQVVSRCVAVSGQVKSVRHEDDGDVHFDLAVDPAYRGMLTPGNASYQHGWLVVEIVPADEPGCTVGSPPRAPEGSYDYGSCTGADVQAPSPGQHVWVTGPYVIDHVHNWAEVHPAWRVATSAPAARPAPAPAPAPATTSSAPRPTASSAAPVASTALTCQAHMSNPTPSQYSTTDAIVQTGAAGSGVSATAHYKSTDTTNTGSAGSDGVADIPFRISRATKGYTVEVDVVVSAAGQQRTCSTSFTPQ